MNFLNIAFVTFIVCLLLTLTFGEEESNNKRGNLLLRRPGARAGPLAKSTTTTPAPKESDDVGDEEYDQIDDLDEAEKETDETAVSTASTTTSTEPPKKIGPIIRPFRSNDDLLLALKRRQQTVKKVSVEKPIAKLQGEGSEKEESSAPAPASRPSSGARTTARRFGGAKGSSDSGEEASAPGDEGAPAKKPSRFALRPARSN